MDFKKYKIFFLFLSLILTSGILSAQEEEYIRCASDEYNKELLKSNPQMMGSEKFEEKIAKHIKANKLKASQRGVAVVYTIPVVVHVIHNGEPIGTGTNISDAQVLSQIQVLNEDFRRLTGTRGFNSHASGADVEVEFCLARRTPDNCTTNGINRIDMSATSTSWSGPSGNTDTVLKPATIWDPSKYMNIWTVQFASGSLLGYAQFPNGTANTDGVVVNYQNFGTDDDPSVTIGGNFNLGRTLTHEVGHYLGLYHTFHGNSCTGTNDLCDDTPAIAESNSGCPTGIDSCPAQPGIDMIENYMDYTYDSCMNVFTNDQKARMRAAIETAPNRPTTNTSNVCTPFAAVNDDGDLKIEKVAIEDCGQNAMPSVIVSNWGTQTLTSATITYDIDGGTPSNYNWTGTLSNGQYEVVSLPSILLPSGDHTLNVSINNPNGNTDQRSCNNTASSTFNIVSTYPTTSQVHLELTADNFGLEISWEFRDSNNTLLYSGGSQLDNSTINESFDVVVDECYTFTIFDSANDGICCGANGNGSYTLRTDDNTVIATGGEFAASESVKISTITLSTDEYFVNNKVTLYPNPTSNILNIKLANNAMPDSYKIYNMLGQLISTTEVKNVSQLEINTSALSNGMYFIKLFKEGSTTSLPFIKE